MSMKALAAVRVVDTHWLIEDGFAGGALALLENTPLQRASAEERREAAGTEHIPQAAVRGGGGSARKPYEMADGGVAVIDVSGPLTKQLTCAAWLMGGTSTEWIRQQVRQAAADPDVKAIAYRVYSPGGQVAGIADLADDIRAAAETKRSAAYIEDLGASAAYWLACACPEIHANAGAIVGSIGVYSILLDTSKQAEMVGERYVVVKDGDFKAAGAPGTVITAEQEAEALRIVQSIGDQFRAAVGQGRGMDAAQVKAVADGRVHMAAEAQTLNLIDGIASWDAVLGDLADNPALGQRMPKPDDSGKIKKKNDTKKDDGAKRGAKGNTMLREGFARALAGLGLNGMAMAVLGMQADADGNVSPEAMADKLAGQVEAEAQAKVAKNPLLIALTAQNITTEAQIADLGKRAKLGDAYVADLRETTKKQAVAALGAEVAKASYNSIDAASPELLKAMGESYAGIVTGKFDARAGKGASRKSAAPTLPTARTPETEDEQAEQKREAAKSEGLNPAAVYARMNGSK